jgi:hypothetical protein
MILAGCGSGSNPAAADEAVDVPPRKDYTIIGFFFVEEV